MQASDAFCSSEHEVDIRDVLLGESEFKRADDDISEQQTSNCPGVLVIMQRK